MRRLGEKEASLVVVFLFQFSRQAKSGVEFEHSGHGQRDFPFASAEGKQVRLGSEHQAGRNHEKEGTEHLLTEQATHGDAASVVALYQLQRAEEEGTGAEHIRTVVRQRGYHGKEGAGEQKETAERESKGLQMRKWLHEQ